jgi:hypothetical protein
VKFTPFKPGASTEYFRLFALVELSAATEHSNMENGESRGRKSNKLSVGYPARLAWKSDW